MTTYDDREKGFERKFAHDEEIAFKITARRNKLLGLWVAEKLGKTGADAEQYAKDVVLSDFESAGDGDVIAKVLKDLGQANIDATAAKIEAELARFAPIAREQIAGAKK